MNQGNQDLAYLSLESVCLKYHQTEIVRDISLSLKPKHVLSILGKSGCGKSSLFQSILGAIEPYSGRIIKRVDSIAYMPQNDLLLPWRTVIDNLLLPYELGHKTKSMEHAKDECWAWLSRFGFEAQANQYPKQLSGGMKKRIALLRAFLTDSPLMMLDEPFSALDYFTKLEMYAFLLSLLESSQKSLLMITHDIQEAILLSDQVIILGGNPTHIKQTQLIELPRPRSIDLLLSEELMAYQKILSLH